MMMMEMRRRGGRVDRFDWRAEHTWHSSYILGIVGLWRRRLLVVVVVVVMLLLMLLLLLLLRRRRRRVSCTTACDGARRGGNACVRALRRRRRARERVLPPRLSRCSVHVVLSRHTWSAHSDPRGIHGVDDGAVRPHYRLAASSWRWWILRRCGERVRLPPAFSGGSGK